PESDEYVAAWREAIEQSDDLGGIVDSVRVRKEMTTDALLSHIVLTAGVAKNNRSLTGARTVIEVLKAGGVLTEADGTFRASPDSLADASARVGDQAQDSSTPKVPASGRTQSATSSAPSVTGHARTQVQVHVHIW